MSKTRFLVLAAGFVAAGSANAGILGSELVVNGDFETGDLSGWMNNGLQARPSSVATFGGLDDPSTIGDFSATGGPGAFFESASQSFALTGLAGQVDAGMIQYNLFALLQSRSGGLNSDDASVSLDFRDAAEQPLGGFTITDPADSIAWDEYEAFGVLPAGTRSIELTISVSRVAGGSGDGFIDNVSLFLTEVPAPSTAYAFLVGASALLRRRRCG